MGVPSPNVMVVEEPMQLGMRGGTDQDGAPAFSQSQSRTLTRCPYSPTLLEEVPPRRSSPTLLLRPDPVLSETCTTIQENASIFSQSGPPLMSPGAPSANCFVVEGESRETSCLAESESGRFLPTPTLIANAISGRSVPMPKALSESSTALPSPEAAPSPSAALSTEYHVVRGQLKHSENLLAQALQNAHMSEERMKVAREEADAMRDAAKEAEAKLYTAQAEESAARSARAQVEEALLLLKAEQRMEREQRHARHRRSRLELIPWNTVQSLPSARRLSGGRISSRHGRGRMVARCARAPSERV